MILISMLLGLSGCALNEESIPGSPDADPAVSPSTDASASGATERESVLDNGRLTEAEISGLLPRVPVTTAPPGVVYEGILERQEAKLECLREYGFEGEIDDDLGISMPLPPAQQDRFFEVSAICREQTRPSDATDLTTEERLTLAFRAFLYTRECMVQQGFPVDDPPSLERYVETMGEIWHPYNAFTSNSIGGQSFQELEQTCPQDLSYLIPALGLDRP